MKKLILVLLLTMSAYAEVDHKTSWPKVEPGGAAGADATPAIIGGSNDESGTIVLWTGSTTAGPGNRRVVLVTYGQPYDTTQRPVITAGNEEAAVLHGDSGGFAVMLSPNRL